MSSRLAGSDRVGSVATAESPGEFGKPVALGLVMAPVDNVEDRDRTTQPTRSKSPSPLQLSYERQPLGLPDNLLPTRLKLVGELVKKIAWHRSAPTQACGHGPRRTPPSNSGSRPKHAERLPRPADFSLTAG